MAKTTRPKTENKADVTEAVEMPDPVPTGPVVIEEPTPAEPPPIDERVPVELNMPPAAEPQPEMPTPPPPPGKAKSGFGGMVVGGVIAAALGYGVATYAPIPGLSDRTSEAQTMIAALSDRLAVLETAPAPAADAGLTDRVQALEQRAAPEVPDLAPILSPVTEAITSLDARLTTLETAPRAEGSAASPELAAAVDALRAEVEAMKGSGQDVSAEIAAAAADANARLAEAEAQAAQLKAEAEETARKAMQRAAVSRLQGALESGAPFASALENLGGLEVPASLASIAQTGVPSQSVLEDAFPAAARAALEASLQANMGASWSERLGSFLQSTTGARSLTPREGTDPDAVLSRSEAALKTGDLEGSVAEIAGLPPEGQAAMADFVALVATRQAAINDVNALSIAIEE